MPLLVGKVQFGRPLNKNIPLYKAELRIRKVFTMLQMENMKIMDQGRYIIALFLKNIHTHIENAAMPIFQNQIILLPLMLLGWNK